MSASLPCPDSAHVHTLLHCPACGDAFADVGDSTPQLLSCSHTVCAACAVSMTNVTVPKCVVCGSVIDEGYVVNGGFVGLLGDAAISKGADEDCVAGPLSKKRVVVGAVRRCAKHARAKLIQLCCDCGVWACGRCVSGE